MLYQYSHRLGAYAPGLDPDAKAYIAAVETALSSSISADQKNAINTFFKTGKSAGWYSSIKRLYLPIWADAAANAIDMISLTSGTFPVGGVDQSNVGYVQSNGTTGYFDMGVNPTSLGLTTSSESLFALVKTISSTVLTSDYLMGCFESTSETLFLSGNWRGTINTTTGDGNISNQLGTNNNGIVVLDREGGKRGIYLRRNSGLSTVIETTSPDAGSVPNSQNLYAMALNLSGTASISRNDELGAWGAGLGLGATKRDSFSLALKDLWETASGLTLP